MTILNSKETLFDLFKFLEEYIKNTEEYKENIRYESFPRLKQEAIKLILEAPVIIYVKSKSLPANVSVESVLKYLENVIAVDDIHTLVYLYKNLKHYELNEYIVDCILIEKNIKIKKTEVFKTLIFLDYLIKREKKGINKSGHIDYERLEEYVKKIYKKTDLEKYIRRYQKYFYQSILGLNLSVNKSKYIYQVLKNIENIHFINLEEYDFDANYIMKCPICGKKEDISLVGSRKKTNTAKKYIINNKKLKRFEYKCNHVNTIYYEKAYFSVSYNKYKEVDRLNDKEINKIFLYIFFSYVSDRINKTDVIKFYDENEIKTDDIEQFIEKNN